MSGKTADGYTDSATLHLEAQVRATAAARQFVSEHLDRWDCSEECVDVVALLSSEIVGNAVRHAPPPLDLLLLHGTPGIRVEVRDSSPALDHDARPDFDSEGGRGLWLVEMLATQWGYAPATPGKVVWFELHDPPKRHAPVRS